jgi:tetratricopeptide (TPR) repeat protein
LGSHYSVTACGPGRANPWRTLAGLTLITMGSVACVAIPERELVQTGTQEATSVALPPVEEPVYASFDRDTLYGLLVAEFAGRRGQLGLATAQYLELAKKTGDVGIAERATRMALVSRDDEASVSAAGEWARLDEDSLDAAAVNAALLIRVGRIDDAFTEFNRMLYLGRDDPRRAYARITEVLGREQKRDTAFEVMQRIVDGRDADPDARYALAELATRTGKIDRAVSELEAIQAAIPDDERSADLLARVLQMRGDTERAISVLSGFLDRRPAAHGARMSYARLLVGEERFAEARDQFARVADALPDNAEARYDYAIVLLQMEDQDGAREQFEQLARAGKREESSWYFIGQIAEAQDDPKAALAAYRRVIGGEFRLNAQIRMSALMASDGDLTGARAQLQGLRRDYRAERVRLYRAEGDILVRAEQLDEATAVYDAALAELPNNTDLLYARAMVAAQADRVADLERDLREVLSREPENADALNALGYTLADKTDRLEEALTLIERAHVLKPDDHYIVDSMGWVLHRLGRNKDAETQLRRALELQPDAEVAAHLGEVLWALEKRDEARRIWREALEREPEAQEVLETIRRLDAD